VVSYGLPSLGDAPSKGKGHYTLIDMDFFEIEYDGFIKHPHWCHIEEDEDSTNATS
jgi:hypothetical protein